jgi:hypothetical protein
MPYFFEVGRWNHGKQVARNKRRQRRDCCAGQTGNQVANETDGDHHRAGRDMS